MYNTIIIINLCLHFVSNQQKLQFVSWKSNINSRVRDLL